MFTGKASRMIGWGAKPQVIILMSNLPSCFQPVLHFSHSIEHYYLCLLTFKYNLDSIINLFLTKHFPVIYIHSAIVSPHCKAREHHGRNHPSADKLWILMKGEITNIMITLSITVHVIFHQTQVSISEKHYSLPHLLSLLDQLWC